MFFEVYIPCCNFIDGLFVASITEASKVLNRQCLLNYHVQVRSVIQKYSIFRNKLTALLVFEQSSLARNGQLEECVHIFC